MKTELKFWYKIYQAFKKEKENDSSRRNSGYTKEGKAYVQALPDIQRKAKGPNNSYPQ